MTSHHYRGRFISSILALLGAMVADAGADVGASSPKSVYIQMAPNYGDDVFEIITLTGYDGTWSSARPFRAGAATAGSITIKVTPGGRVYGTIWNGEESESFDGSLARRGLFNLPLSSGGRIRGRVRDQVASGRIIHGGRAAKWTADLSYIERTNLRPVSPIYVMQYVSPLFR